MPEPPKIYLDPNYNPNTGGLPEIPEEIKNYKNKLIKRRKIVLIILGTVILLGMIFFIIWNLQKTDKKYRYIKLISASAAQIGDSAPGADIESVVIGIGNLEYYGDKIANTSINFDQQNNNNYKDAQKALGAPSKSLNDYVSLGDKNNFIVITTIANLRDSNISTLTINEASSKQSDEAYDVYIGTSKNGPWDYVGRKNGTAIIDLSNFF